MRNFLIVVNNTIRMSTSGGPFGGLSFSGDILKEPSIELGKASKGSIPVLGSFSIDVTGDSKDQLIALTDIGLVPVQVIIEDNSVAIFNSTSYKINEIKVGKGTVTVSFKDSLAELLNKQITLPTLDTAYADYLTSVKLNQIAGTSGISWVHAYNFDKETKNIPMLVGYNRKVEATLVAYETVAGAVSGNHWLYLVGTFPKMIAGIAVSNRHPVAVYLGEVLTDNNQYGFSFKYDIRDGIEYIYMYSPVELTDFSGSKYPVFVDYSYRTEGAYTKLIETTFQQIYVPTLTLGTPNELVRGVTPINEIKRLLVESGATVSNTSFEAARAYVELTHFLNYRYTTSVTYSSQLSKLLDLCDASLYRGLDGSVSIFIDRPTDTTSASLDYLLDDISISSVRKTTDVLPSKKYKLTYGESGLLIFDAADGTGTKEFTSDLIFLEPTAVKYLQKVYNEEVYSSKYLVDLTFYTSSNMSAITPGKKVQLSLPYGQSITGLVTQLRTLPNGYSLSVEEYQPDKYTSLTGSEAGFSASKRMYPIVAFNTEDADLNLFVKGRYTTFSDGGVDYAAYVHGSINNVPNDVEPSILGPEGTYIYLPKARVTAISVARKGYLVYSYNNNAYYFAKREDVASVLLYTGSTSAAGTLSDLLVLGVADAAAGYVTVEVFPKAITGENMPIGISSQGLTWEDVQDPASTKPESNATKGAVAGINLLAADQVEVLSENDIKTVNRISTTIDGTGKITSLLDASDFDGPGLYLGANYFGYHNGTSWKTYLDNTGKFELNGLSSSLTWDPTGDGTLSITGQVTASSGTIGGWTLGSVSLTSGNMTISASTGINFNSVFTVNASGAMSATSGTIGGWTLGSVSLTSGNMAISASDGINFNGLFTVNASGAMAATSGTIGGWLIQSDLLRSAASGARVELNKAKSRISVFDAMNEKVAMGYLEGLPKNDGNGNWGSNDYGFWARAGDKLQIDGDTDYVSGDWQVKNDAAVKIFATIDVGGTPTDVEIIRLGTDSGAKGLFIYDESSNVLAKYTSSAIEVGDSREYLKYSPANGLSISGMATSRLSSSDGSEYVYTSILGGSIKSAKLQTNILNSSDYIEDGSISTYTWVPKVVSGVDLSYWNKIFSVDVDGIFLHGNMKLDVVPSKLIVMGIDCAAAIRVAENPTGLIIGNNNSNLTEIMQTSSIIGQYNATSSDIVNDSVVLGKFNVRDIYGGYNIELSGTNVIGINNCTTAYLSLKVTDSTLIGKNNTFGSTDTHVEAKKATLIGFGNTVNPTSGITVLGNSNQAVGLSTLGNNLTIVGHSNAVTASGSVSASNGLNTTILGASNTISNLSNHLIVLGNSNIAAGSSNYSVLIGNIVGNPPIGEPPTYTDSVLIGKNVYPPSSTGVIAIGQSIYPYGTSADYNIMIGYGTAYASSSTSSIYIGRGAGSCDPPPASSSSNNTVVGYNAFLNTGSYSNCTALGYQAAVTGSNQVQLGNSSTTTYVYGTVQSRSDLRDKADIKDTSLGLDFIMKLRPVDYKWDYRESYIDIDEEGQTTTVEKDGSRKGTRYHHGLIAQEVVEVLQQENADFGGLQHHSVKGGKDVYSIGYDELIAPLIKAIQEQQAQILALQQEVAELKKAV